MTSSLCFLLILLINNVLSTDYYFKNEMDKYSDDDIVGFFGGSFVIYKYEETLPLNYGVIVKESGIANIGSNSDVDNVIFDKFNYVREGVYFRSSCLLGCVNDDRLIKIDHFSTNYNFYEKEASSKNLILMHKYESMVLDNLIGLGCTVQNMNEYGSVFTNFNCKLNTATYYTCERILTPGKKLELKGCNSMTIKDKSTGKSEKVWYLLEEEKIYIYSDSSCKNGKTLFVSKGGIIGDDNVMFSLDESHSGRKKYLRFTQYTVDSFMYFYLVDDNCVVTPVDLSGEAKVFSQLEENHNYNKLKLHNKK